MACILVGVAPTSAWALSAACADVNRASGMHTASDNYDGYQGPDGFAADEVIHYSYSNPGGPDNGPYVNILMYDPVTNITRPGVENGTATSGSGTIKAFTNRESLFVWADDRFFSLSANVSPIEPARTNKSFTVTISCSLAEPTLGLTASHTGTPGQGQSFSLTPTLSNTGDTATAGAVTLTATLPAGLTYSAFSGTNWNCAGSSGSNISCAFSGTIAAGASNNALSIVTDVSASSATSRTVTMAVSGGGASNTPSASDAIVMLPTIASIAPTSGPSGGGNSVVITGTNLFGTTGAAGVRFGTANATSYTVNSNTQIIATAPAHSAGAIDISVTNGGNTSASSSADRYTYAGAPTVTGRSPTSGPTAGGTTVVITGTGFAGASGVGAVKFGATDAVYTINSDTQITATSPANSAGTYDITVTTSGGTSTTSAADQFTYVSAPTVALISPTSGPTAGGTSVIITGTNFTGATGVSFGATPASTITVINATTITATAPAGSGIVDVTVTSPGGTSATSAGDRFTYAGAPVASSFTAPAVAYNSGGAAATSIAVSGHATNNPTSYAPGSATTANGGSVSINSAGTASYTPATGFRGNDSFTFTATNAGGISSPATVTVPVSNPVLAISLTGSGGTAGTALSGVSVTPSGGRAPYICGTTLASGALPSGVSLGSNCALSGTPTTGGTFNFTVAVTDSSTGTGPFTQTSGTLTLSIAAAPPVVAAASANVSYNTAKAIDLSGSIAGAHTSIAIVSTPAHGATSVAGDVVTYTPASGYFGADSFTYTATGPGGTSNAAIVTLTVATPAAPTVAAASASVSFNTAKAIDLSGAIAGVHSSVAVAGGPAHGTTSVAGDVVTYTPANNYAGADSFTYTATGPGGTSAAATVTVTVAKGIQTITFPNPGSINFGTTTPLVATANSGLTVTFTSQTTNVCVVSSGQIVTVAPGTCTIRANQGGNASFLPAPEVDQTFAVVIPGGAVSITTASLPPSTRGVPYSQAITASGGAQPYTFTHTGALPSGLTLNSSTGVLSGTPTQSGTFPFQVTVTDAATQTASQNYTITVIAPAFTFTPTALPAGQVGVAYPGAASPITAAGGIAPYTYSAPAGTLPPGLGLSSVGVLSGTPTTAGSYSVTITATDAFGATGDQAYTIAIGQAVPVTVNDNANVVANNAVIIPVTSNDTGPITSVAVATAPAHGTATVSGLNVGYTPAHDFVGADSFTYTVTGPGGTSSAATVTVAVVAPPAPSVAAASANVPYNTAKAIDLSASITGIHSSIAVATAPAHGTTSIAGNVVTYTPNTGYFGPDNLAYTATGLGGTSAPATVNLTVATPAPPTAANKSGVAVPYGSSGVAIDLSSSVSGVHTSIATATAPSHGSVTISGDTATYVPAVGYFGSDTFTFTAAGPGGTSAPATVTLTVATPPVPVVTDKSGVAIPYDSPGTAIDLSGSVSGVHTGIAIGTAPTHGSVTIAGNTATYIPTTGYFGADSFSFTATGPGGTSTAATVSIVVATPPPPMAKSGNGTVASSSQVQKSVDINLSALVTGDYTGIELASTATHGTVTLHGAQGSLSVGQRGGPTVIATYAPASGFAGTDAFSFVAVGPGGRSAPATVTITVTGTAPTAAAKTARAIDNQLVSVELTDGATEGPFTAAAIVNVSPADKATAKIVAGGSASSPTYRLDVTPAAHFGGTVVVTYTLSNQFGTSAPSTVTITVTARPDPSLDPNVRALSDAQAESTRRFAQSQSQNFLQRAERLHNGGGSSKPQMGITLGSSDTSRAGSPGYPLGQREQQDIADRSRDDVRDDTTSASTPQTVDARGRSGAQDKSAFSDGNSSGDGERRAGSIAIWSGGQIEIGTRDQTTDRDKISMTSGGLSAGADLKLSNAATVGVGGGVGFDSSKIGGQAATLRGDSSVVAGYGSIAPLKNMFVDFVVGYGDLSFTSRRAVDGTTANGSRDGSMWFGAASAGIDRVDGTLRWSLYGRGEWLDGTLGAYTESGAGIMDLRFDARDVSSLTGVLGGRFELEEPLTIGMFRPRLRVEWSHEFQNSSIQKLDYADVSGAAFYGIRTEGWTRDDYQVAMGGALYTQSRWIIDLELGLRGASGERDGTLTMKLSKEF